jgi:hypothetical protein
MSLLVPLGDGRLPPPPLPPSRAAAAAAQPHRSLRRRRRRLHNPTPAARADVGGATSSLPPASAVVRPGLSQPMLNGTAALFAEQ